MQSTCYSCQNFKKFVFSRQIFFKDAQMLNFFKIGSVATELFYANGRADKRRDTSQIRVAFRSLANAPKNEEKINIWWTKKYWDMFLFENYSVFYVSVPFHPLFILIPSFLPSFIQPSITDAIKVFQWQRHYIHHLDKQNVRRKKWHRKNKIKEEWKEKENRGKGTKWRKK
jgi:hypothetical protein